MTAAIRGIVMPGLDPGIRAAVSERVDGRVKPGHDDLFFSSEP
jgi:hypothetical protein